MLWKVVWLVAMLLVASSPYSRHDFHVSLADVRYDTAKRRFQVALRIFTDDLEAALTRASRQPVRYMQMGKDSSPDPILVEYLQKNFYIRHREKVFNQIYYLGKENVVDVTWIYFEIEASDFTPAQLEWCYSVLFELFDDQTNLLNLQLAGRRLSLLFDRRRPIQKLPWKD